MCFIDQLPKQKSNYCISTINHMLVSKMSSYTSTILNAYLSWPTGSMHHYLTLWNKLGTCWEFSSASATFSGSFFGVNFPLDARGLNMGDA